MGNADSWSSLIPFLLVVLIVVFFILWVCFCIQVIESRMERRTDGINLIETGLNTDTDDFTQCIQAIESRIERRINERIDEINLIENGLNNNTDDFTQRRIEPSAPLEEIYSIENAPNMYTTDTNPPPYSEIMENEMELEEPPPSYLVSLYRYTIV